MLFVTSNLYDFAWQGWRRLNRGADVITEWADVILADFQRIISCYLHDSITYFSCATQRVLRALFMQTFKPKCACLPCKIIEVWIDRFCVRYDWWRRLQPTSSVSPVCIMLDSIRWMKHRFPLQDNEYIILYVSSNITLKLPITWVVIHEFYKCGRSWRVVVN